MTYHLIAVEEGVYRVSGENLKRLLERIIVDMAPYFAPKGSNSVFQIPDPEPEPTGPAWWTQLDKYGERIAGYYDEEQLPPDTWDMFEDQFDPREELVNLIIEEGSK